MCLVKVADLQSVVGSGIGEFRGVVEGLHCSRWFRSFVGWLFIGMRQSVAGEVGYVRIPWSTPLSG